MNIGIDIRLIAYRRGMGNFVYHLVNQLAQLPTAHQFFLYTDAIRLGQNVPRDPRFQVKVLRPRLYPVWEQILLPWQAARDRVDVLHCPANTAPIMKANRTRLVLTLHDVMYMLPGSVLPFPPSVYQRLGRLYRRTVVPRAAAHATRITTDSHFSQSDIVKRLQIPAPRITVIPLAPSPAFHKLADGAYVQAVRDKYGLPRPLIITLGAIDPRKNTARIIEAFSLFQAQDPSAHQLAITGLSAREHAYFATQVRRWGLEDSVQLLGFIGEEELVALYNAAEMLVYPSLYEGFGLPVLEAMACGTPVISSTVTSLPEIAGTAALLVAPTNTAALAQAMAQIANDSGLKERLVQRGHQQVRPFSWPRTARETLAVYEQAAAE